MSKVDKQKQKLIDDYQKAALKYTTENKELEQKIEDLKTTLKLNQELLYDYIINSTGSGGNEEVNNLINNTKKIWKDTQDYIEQKNLVELKIARLQELIEDTPTKIREEINDITIKNNKIQEEINDKDKIIKKLKIELDKTRKNALFKKARTEIYVTEPTRVNIDNGQELLILKSFIAKITPVHKKKMEDSTKLKVQIEELRGKLEKLIEKAYDIYSRINHKKRKDSISNTNEYNKDDLNNLLNSIEGYDLEADQIEEEDEDDDDEYIDNNKDDDSDDNYNEDEISNNKKKMKAKEKELERLTEQYQKIKSECQEYESKINKHKKIYKDIKTKMKNLRESVNDNY